MEKDDDIKGSWNSYTTEFREYDPRIARWFSIDPEFKNLSGKVHMLRLTIIQFIMLIQEEMQLQAIQQNNESRRNAVNFVKTNYDAHEKLNKKKQVLAHCNVGVAHAFKD